VKPQYFVRQGLYLIALSKHLEEPDVGVVGPKDVGGHAVALGKRPDEFREDVPR